MKYLLPIFLVTILAGTGCADVTTQQTETEAIQQEHFDTNETEEQTSDDLTVIEDGWTTTELTNFSVSHPIDWIISELINGFQLYPPEPAPEGEFVKKIEMTSREMHFFETTSDFLESEEYTQLETIGTYEWATGKTNGPLSINDAAFGIIQNEQQTEVIAYNLTEQNELVRKIVATISFN
ncbi:MAG: hypothetical protein P8J32_01010 [bacterium]|jgi:hypothetical protein|nr:hypothetical protein [bacterium]